MPINNGILGGFSGTVGTVVGGNWKGIDYMRSKGKKAKDANWKNGRFCNMNGMIMS